MSTISTLITTARLAQRTALADNYQFFYGALAGQFGERCARCGATGKMQIDHIHPVAQGGVSELWNLQLLCAACNNAKGNHLADYRTAPSAKTPRPYQLKALTAIEAAFARGMRRPVCAMATGLGKTYLAANLIKRRAHLGRALFLAPIDEVVFQNAKAVQLENPGTPVGIVKASLNQKNSRIVVASLHTVRKKNRLAMFAPHSFDTVIVDECHLNLDAFKAVIDHVASPDALIVGLSATPERLDGRGLDEVFDDIAFEMSLIDGIREGWLCEPISLQFSLKGADFSSVTRRGGDMDQNQVAEFIRKAENWKEAITEQWRTHAGHLKTAMFVGRVEMARELADHLRAGGIRAATIDGAMDKGERRKKLADYESGQLQVLVNVACLNTGWDSPTTECLLIGTLTASKSRYLQTLGRGTRLLPGVIDGLETAEERLAAIAASSKPNFLVMDLVGVTKRHKLINLASLAGKEKPLREREGLLDLTADGERERAAAAAEQEERERIEAEFEARRVSLINGQEVPRFEWKQHATARIAATLFIRGNSKRIWEVIRDEASGSYLASVGKPSSEDQYKRFQTLNEAKRACEEEASTEAFLSRHAEKKPAAPTFPWHSLPNGHSTLTLRNGRTITLRPMADGNWIATDKKDFRAICATEPEARAAAEAQVGWEEHLATEAQLEKLKKWRIRHDPATITKGEASALIGRKLAEFKAKAKAKGATV